MPPGMLLVTPLIDLGGVTWVIGAVVVGDFVAEPGDPKVLIGLDMPVVVESSTGSSVSGSLLSLSFVGDTLAGEAIGEGTGTVVEGSTCASAAFAGWLMSFAKGGRSVLTISNSLTPLPRRP